MIYSISESVISKHRPTLVFINISHFVYLYTNDVSIQLYITKYIVGSKEPIIYDAYAGFYQGEVTLLGFTQHEGSVT